MAFGIRLRLQLVMDRLSALVAVPLECGPQGITTGMAGRASPRASVLFDVGGRPALLCYGRPSARGRPVFGGLVPYGELWRLGANEPTVLHLPFAARVAGVRVRRGKLALYAIPGPTEWTLVLNRSTRQWGLTRPERGKDGILYGSAYSAAVKSAEIGRAVVSTSSVRYTEQLTAHAEVVDARRTSLHFEWETTRVTVPVES